MCEYKYIQNIISEILWYNNEQLQVMFYKLYLSI